MYQEAEPGSGLQGGASSSHGDLQAEAAEALTTRLSFGGHETLPGLPATWEPWRWGGQYLGLWRSLWAAVCSWTVGGGRHTHPETAFREVPGSFPFL